MSFLSRSAVALAAAMLLSFAGSAEAGWWHRHHACARYLSCCGWHASACTPCCIAPCAPAACAPCVTRSYRCEPVYCSVPRTCFTTEYDIVQDNVVRTCYRQETRERTVTTYHTIAVPQQVTRSFTVSVPEIQTAVRNVPVVRTHTEMIPQTYTVAIPQTEMRTGYRNCVRTHVDMVEKMVCRTVGHWEESCDYVSRTVYRTRVVPTCGVGCADVAYATSCGTPCGHFGCGLGWRLACGWHSHHCGSACCTPCVTTCKVVCEPVECGQWVTRRNWVPETIWEPIQVPICRYESYQVPYQYPVTTCRYETRTRQVPVLRATTHYVPQTYSYTTYRPEVRTRVDTITTYRQIPKTCVQTYTVSIPYTVNETVDRIVCRSVPHTTYECVLTGYRMVECEVPATTCATCN